MIGVEDVTEVHSVLLLASRLLAVDHPEKISRLSKRGIGLHDALPATEPMEISGYDGDLRDQPQRLSLVSLGRIFVGLCVVTAKRRNSGANRVHRRGFLRESA